MNRPLNILFLMADQLAPHFLSAYGHKVVKTPRLDDMAADSKILVRIIPTRPCVCPPGQGC